MNENKTRHEQEETMAIVEAKAEVPKAVYLCDACLERCDTKPHYKCMECQHCYHCLPCHDKKLLQRQEDDDHDNKFGCRHAPETYIRQQTGSFSTWFREIDAVADQGVGRQLLLAMEQFSERHCVFEWSEEMNDNNDPVPLHAYTTYGEVVNGAKKLLYGLYRRGAWKTSTEPTRVAVWMPNSVPWVVTDVALAIGGACSVPIHAGADATMAGFVLHKTASHVLFVHASLLEQRLQQLDPVQLTHLKHVVVVDDRESRSTVTLPPSLGHCTIHSYHDLLQEAQGAVDLNAVVDRQICVPRSPHDPFTLIFTSGSTGRPKGVIQTHHMMRDCAFPDRRRWLPWDPTVAAVFTPLCYATARWTLWRTLGVGGRVVLLPDGAQDLFARLPRIKPSFLSGPPLVFQELYRQFQRDWNAIAKERQPVELDISSLANSQARQDRLAKARRKLLYEYAQKVGRRCNHVSVGGAKSSDELLAFLKECFEDVGHINFSHGYGTSEGGRGLVDGQLQQGTHAVLLDVPEMGFYADGDPKRGELCLSSDYDTPGYWGEPELTEKLFLERDGKRYLRTGDIVEIREGKFHIIDRRSSIIKASNGVFISPEHLESVFLSSCNEIVRHVFVHMECAWDFPLAVVSVIDPATTPDDILNAFRRAALKEGIRVIPHGVLISSEPFSVENKLLTVSMKLARQTLRQRFQDQLGTMYENLRESTTGLEVAAPGAASGILEQLQELYRTTIRVPHAHPDDTAQLLGADSLTILQLLSHIQDLFRRKLTIQVLWTSTIEEISKMVSIADTGAGAFRVDATEFPGTSDDGFAERVEASTYFSVGKVQPVSRDPSELPCHVLLTGVTGFIGRSVLSSLLSSDPSLHVTCLVRSKNKLDAFDRLKAVCDVNAQAMFGERVHVVCGDLGESNPLLGLLSAEVERLKERVTTIVHCGAFVNHSLPFTELEACNVTNVRHLVEMFGPGASNLQRFVHVSSVSVDALASTDNGTEEEPQPAREILSREIMHKSNGYALSKWAAERLVENVKTAYATSTSENRCPFDVSIVRCGMTSWDTRSGVGNLTDWLCKWCQMVGYTKQYPVAGDIESPPTSQGRWLELVPVDCTAENIVDCALCSGEPPSIQRLSNPHLFDVESHVFKPLGAQPVPFDTWKTTLQNIVNESPVDSQVWRLAVTMLSMFPTYESLPGLDERPREELDDGSVENHRLLLEQSSTLFVEWIRKHIPGSGLKATPQMQHNSSTYF